MNVHVVEVLADQCKHRRAGAEAYGSVTLHSYQQPTGQAPMMTLELCHPCWLRALDFADSCDE